MKAEVVIDGLGVRFQLDRQRRPVTPGMARLRHRCTTQWPLRGLTLAIESGAAVALVGPNGVGKTTLLRAIAGVLPADEGRVAVRGRIGSLLSVDAGLMAPLTGRENALLLGVLAGLSEDVVSRSLEQIRERAGLDQAFDRPVATYSQGMRARLGFSVIEQTDPDVLLLDEVVEALDDAFRGQLETYAAMIRKRGGIVVAAGHDHVQLTRLCDRALVLGRAGVSGFTSLERADPRQSRLGVTAGEPSPDPH